MAEWNSQVNELFAKAIELESSEEQRALLDSACGEDPELRAGVERLLKAHNDAGSFLNKPPDGLAPTFTTGENDTVDESDAEFSLDFLTPTDKPNCLGTLGQYEAIEVVGRGGMGLVLRGYDTRLNRVVAIKVMAPELAVNPMAVKRFLREARAAAAVSHDHVVTIHAIEEDNKPPFIVMEYVDGKSLHQKVDEAGALDLKEILRIGMQTARGLSAAHEQGLIHRDIKPANILLENGIERVQLTDFGLARATDDVSVTQTGQIAGTPQYMSPEQAEGKLLDSRSDLFSLGSVLYTLCTGRPPFRAESVVAILRRVTEETPRPISEINAEIPEWLEAIIGKLLAKNPDERFQSADEVASLLGKHLAHEQDPQSAPLPARVALPAEDVEDFNSTLTLWNMFRWGVVPTVIAASLLWFGNYLVRSGNGSVVIDSDVDDLELTIVEIIHDSDQKVRRSVDWNMSNRHVVKGSQTLSLPAGQYEILMGERSREVALNMRKFTLGKDKEIRILVRRRNGQSLKLERLLTGHTATVTAVDISPDGKSALSASGWPNGDGTLRLWDLSSATEIRQFKGHACPIVRAFFSPDGKRIIAGGTNSDAFVYDVETADLVGALRGFKSDFRHGIALLPDGEHALIGEGVGSLHICRIDTGKVVHTLKQPDDRVMAIAVSPDGTRAVATSGDEVYAWDLETRQQIGRFRQHSELVQSVAFSHDGKKAVSASIDKTVRVWDVETQEQLQVFRGHTAGVLCARFTFDDRRVVSGSHDETIRVWDVTNGKPLYEANTSRQSIWSVAVTPDGKRILSGGGQHDKTDVYRLKEFDLRLWQIPGGDATTEQQQTALVAAEAWLKLVDSGQYAEAWEACAEQTRKADDKQTLVTTYTQLFSSIGKLESRQLLTNRYASEQATEFVNVQYDTQFATKRVTETVALIREDDGTWRVSGYFHAPRIVASSPSLGNVLTNPPSLPAAGLPTEKNLILDSSLEGTPLSRLPKSWSAWLDDGPDFKCEVVDGGVTGKHCLQISGTGTRGVVFATSIPMDRTKRYALKGHVKVEGDAGTWAVIKLNYFNKTGWLGVDDRVGVKSGETGWQFFEKTDRANAFPEATLLVPTCHIEGSGTAWFDDLEVVAYDREYLPEDFDKKHGKNNRMYSLE